MRAIGNLIGGDPDKVMSMEKGKAIAEAVYGCCQGFKDCTADLTMPMINKN